jgi:dipeptidyl aminopeptidase/acylaminoacyl peptidase
MKRFPLLLSLPVLLLALASTAAQAQAPKKMTAQATLMLPSYGGYQLAPAGDRMLFTKSTRDAESLETTSHIYLMDVASGRITQLTSSPKGESNPRWLDDRRVLFSSDRDGRTTWWVISTDGGEATKLVDDEKAPNNGSFSPDYKRAAFTEASERPDKKEWDDKVKKKDDGYYAEKKLTYTQIWVYDIASKQRKQITSGPYDNQGPTWSPDGRWLAFSSNRTGTQMGDPNRSDNTDLFLVPSDSGATRQLTTNRGPDRGPVFSPDGRWIAYTSSDFENHSANQFDVKVIPVGDPGEPVNLTAKLDYSVSGIEWSPDGRHIYFRTDEGLGSALYRVAATGGLPERVLPDDENVYTVESKSKDGSKWVITSTSLSDPGSVYIADNDGRNRRLLFRENDGLKEFAMARAEPIQWKGADGWTIDGILTYPLDYQAGQKVPLILQIHGGPFGRYSKTFSTGTQVWAARGYAVLQSNPRGSSGYTLEFGAANVKDWGGKDFQDIMRGVDHVIALGVADPDRMGVMGGSYGGFMTFWTVTQTDRFKAAIGHAGITDWYSFYGQTDIPYLLEFGFGGDPWETKRVYEKYSPIEYAMNVKTPLLITHGEQDRRVPISQGEQYYRTLKKAGKPVEMLRFPREGHGIAEPRHRLFLDQEQEKWFAKYILGQSRPVSATGGGNGSK